MATEQSVFTKKHEEVMAHDKRAILEELNLPPAVVTFIRQNAKALKVGIILFIVVVVAWEAYGEYRHRQLEKASSLLYTAVQSTDQEAKEGLLQQIIEEFPRSKSRVWAQLELAHQAFQNKEYDDAVQRYKEVSEDLSTEESLYPLVQLSLAQAYEGGQKSAQSEAAFKKLLDYPGFAAEGYRGLGRLYEQQGKNKQALEMYESYVALPGVENDSSKSMVEYKISQLKEE